MLHVTREPCLVLYVLDAEREDDGLLEIDHQGLAYYHFRKLFTFTISFVVIVMKNSKEHACMHPDQVDVLLVLSEVHFFFQASIGNPFSISENPINLDKKIFDIITLIFMIEHYVADGGWITTTAVIFSIFIKKN